MWCVGRVVRGDVFVISYVRNCTKETFRAPPSLKLGEVVTHGALSGSICGGNSIVSKMSLRDKHFLAGSMHYNGSDGGPKDYAEARRHYGLAAEQGHAEAQRMLGQMHCDGRGGAQDLAEARRLYGLAAAQGHAGARVVLAVMLLKGGPTDLTEARRLLGLAAAQGHEGAPGLLGNMCFHGKGGPQDFAEARRLLGFAAAQGHAGAQARLGGMHRKG